MFTARRCCIGVSALRPTPPSTTRAESATAQRCTLLSVITKDGLKLIQELQDSVRHAQELLMEPLSAEDQQVFMGLLTRLVEAHELRDVAARPEASTAVDGEPPSARRRPRAVKRPL